MPRGDDTPTTTRNVRCAIYTRKSTEDGLEQDFNSLDAQREAGAAFITSQRHEGWTQVDRPFDDGGFSGGNMERPGLKALLNAVRAGEVDVIVVYKVDRLTRSLRDFARIVDVLDSTGASFVSVTQAFNTTTSMGRLTLNVLLSFAQFEREVTGERIRDKVAASKAKGMWMGGVVPLGYEVENRKLVINPAEAETVQLIFRRFIQASSVRALLAELEASGIRTKVRTSSKGLNSGGRVLTRGGLYFLLKNRIYAGEISHRGKIYPGEHPAIIERALFQTVQARLASSPALRDVRAESRRSLLTGLAWDGHHRKLTPTHSRKRLKRYRYYASIRSNSDEQPTWRIPAGDLEDLVTSTICGFLEDARAIHDAVQPFGPTAAELQAIIEMAKAVAGILAAREPAARECLVNLVNKVQVHETQVDVHFDRAKLMTRQITCKPLPLILSTPAKLVKGPKEVRLVIGAVAPDQLRDPSLIKLIARAYAARVAIEQGSDENVEQIARRLGYGIRHFRVLLRIGYLAPHITQAILEGTQPVQLTSNKLARMSDLPADWAEQSARFGFASP